MLLCFTLTNNAQRRYTRHKIVLYSGPNTSYPVVGTVPSGGSVKVEKETSSGWVAVSYGSFIGYTNSSNLSLKRIPSNSVTKSIATNSSDTGSQSIAKTQNILEPPPPTVHLTNKKIVFDGVSIYDSYSTAVFMVFTMDSEEKIYQGSGFFVNEKGLAVSNYHVFEDMEAAIIKMSNSDRLYAIDKVIARSRFPDFIVFQVALMEGESTNYIPLAREEPKVGEKVFAIGSPKGLSNTLSSGEISGLRDKGLIQITNPIDHGSSGGALIDIHGEAVGITTGSISAASNLNFAWSVLPLLKYSEY